MVSVSIFNQLEADVTVISNRFIDEYMKDANGEYVKVYLYFVRHAGEVVTIAQAALALDSTETDVRRAVEYWRKAGVFGSKKPVEENSPERAVAAGDADSKAEGEMQASDDAPSPTPDSAAEKSGKTAPQGYQPGISVNMDALSRDENFTTLIYISEQYMSKIFTERDTEVVANLYQNLGMSADLLEYLMEYCAQNGHQSLRYAEKVALNWVSQGIKTVKQAKEASGSYLRRTYAVMKALGLSARNPGKVEQDAISRWFDDYGFSEEIVLAACDRTMERIHTPNFNYVDRILRDWKEAGVRSMKDIGEDDRRRSAEGRKNRDDARNSSRNGNRSTRFSNFEGHGYDYDKMMWDMVNGSAPAGKDAPPADGRTGGSDGTQ